MSKLRSKRRQSPEVWHKANRLMIALVVVGVVSIPIATFLPEWRKHRSLSAQLEKNKAELAKEELVKARREREVNLLKNDPEYLEIVARDRIDVMKPGETIVRLDAPVPKSTPADISTAPAKIKD